MPAHPLDSLLRPGSIAFVGASQRPGSVGDVMLRQVLHGGFRGSLYAVNPRHDRVQGIPCFPSLRALPEPVEHVVLAIADERVEDAFEAAVERGARAATVFSSLLPDADASPSLRERIAARAREAGVRLCGAMSMGFYNFAQRLWMCGFPTRGDHRAGGIALISQSGSALAALVDCDSRLDFSLVVSSGLELNTTVADYLDFALEMPQTRVAALFLESVRDPDAFVACLEKAARRRIPVVVLKLGRTHRGARLARSHSGAMVGDDEVYRALFERHGVVRVRTLDEMAFTLMLFAQPHAVGPGALVAIHDSGGERGLLVDLAADAGVPLTRLAPATVARLARRLDPGLPAENPLDAWGTGHGYLDHFRDCFIDLLQDPGAAAGAVVCDRGPGGTVYPEYPGFLRAAHAATGKPVFLVSNHQGSGSAQEVVDLTREGFPVMDGILPFLHAVRHAFEYRDFTAREADPAPAADAAAVARWRARVRQGEPLEEAEAAAMLGDFGLPVNPMRIATDEEQALAAAQALGWPVVIKTAAPGIVHKSDAGGVHLHVPDAEAARHAWRDLAGRLGPRVVVAPRVPGGVEMILGIKRDAQFGPVVVMGGGGVHAEVFRDAVFAVPPFGADVPRRLLPRLRMRPLLDGVRGAPPADVDAFCRAAARLSALAAALAGDLDAVDVNPVVVHPHGCTAVDATVFPRRSPQLAEASNHPGTPVRTHHAVPQGG